MSQLPITLSAVKRMLEIAEGALAGFGVPGVEALPRIPLLIIKYFEEVKANDEAIDQLASNLWRLEHAILRPIDDARAREDVQVPDTLQRRIDGLNKELALSYQSLNKYEALHGFKKLVSKDKLSSTLADVNNEIKEAIVRFQTEAQITMEMFIVQTHADIRHTQARVEHLDVQVAQAEKRSNLELLTRAKESSWNPTQMCLADTRADIIHDIMKFSEASPEYAASSILLVTGPAGCGKSTIAHSIAQRLSEAHPKLLASTFFFNRGNVQRNTPQLLFSTMAYELSCFDLILADNISAAIEKDRTILSAHFSRQFRTLVLDPIHASWPSTARPIVVVIDALDEAWDDELLSILSEDCAHFPQSFRWIITSRSTPSVVDLIDSQHPHISVQEIKLADSRNRQDIERFARLSIAKVAKQRNLGESWPGDQAVEALISKAGGLFVWISTVYQLLRTCVAPKEQLKRLLSDRPSRNLTEKLAALYSTVLDACPWEDEDFEEYYQCLVGTILALQMPLSPGAIASLLGLTITVDVVLQSLSPVITGISGPRSGTQPLEILHDSFRSFVTQPDKNGVKAKYFIDAEEHGLLLAYRVLVILNRELRIPQLASFIDGISASLSSPGIISTPEPGIVSTELWYSCQYLIPHLLTVKQPSSALCEELEEFLTTTNLRSWMIICASKGSFRGITEILDWSSGVSFHASDGVDPQDLASFLSDLSASLRYMGRLEESVVAVREALGLYRQLSGDSHQSSTYREEFAASLFSMAYDLSNLGTYGEALEAIQEAVTLYRQLDPANFSDALAAALHELTSILYSLGRYSEALKAAEDRVNIRRQLAGQPSANSARNVDLAWALNTLSYRLSDLGRYDEAVAVIREAVVLTRPLKDTQMDTFLHTVPGFLDTLANRLFEARKYNDTLLTIREAVDLQRPYAYSCTLCADNFTELLSTLVRSLVANQRMDEAAITTSEYLERFRSLAEKKSIPIYASSTLRESLPRLIQYLSSLHLDGDMTDALNKLRQLQSDFPMYRMTVARHNPDVKEESD